MTILNTSVSGMLADSNWLSSISQNVANANTTGYKNQETDFSTVVDAVSNTTPGGGVTTSLRSLNALQGNIVSSMTSTNLAVQGSGFFVVSDSSGDLYLTRNGSFVADASGDLVNSAGYTLMGSAVQNGSAPPANALSSLQKVNVSSSGETASPTTSASIAANLPSTATPIAAANLPSVNSATSTFTDQTSIVAYDSLGGAHTIDLYLANTGANTWEVDAYDASTASPGGGFPYSSGPLTTGALTYNPTTGALSSGSPLSFTVPGGQTMSLDLSNTTQLAAAFSVSAATVNGNAPANLQGVSIASNGTMSFSYTNGASVAAYDIPLANVASPDFLTSVNGNAYQASASSGPVFLSSAGSGSMGSIESSSLESSTVDLATELTDMIQAQSAYEANSKVFQTGATILDVLNGLKP
jgi:flagellar hook protein FlgE